MWRDETLSQIWTWSSNLRQRYCDFRVWPYDLEHCATCCTHLWDNFHQVWLSTTYACLNYSIFWCWCIMSRCYIDLWPVDIESSWYIKRHVIKSAQNLSEIEQFSAELLIILRIFTHVMSPFDLDLLTLNDGDLLMSLWCVARLVRSC